MQINVAAAKVSHEHGCVVVKTGNSQSQRFPLSSISALHLDNACHLDTALLYQLMHDHIPVFISSAKQLPINLTTNQSHSPRTGIKRAWFAISSNTDTASYLARRLLKFKIQRQRALVKKLAEQTGQTNMDIAAVIAPLPLLDKSLSLSSLLGKEGEFAKRYFRALRHFLPGWCHFAGRQKRPPPDPVNGLLSLSYTLVQDVITRALIKQGFDPVFGVLHQDCDYRHSFSCDLMEIWRASVDAWVIALLNDFVLLPPHFTTRDNSQGVRLSKQGQAIFYRQWHMLRPAIERRVYRQTRQFSQLVRQYG